MPEKSAKSGKPFVVINPFLISWKNVLIPLLIGTTLIGAGLVGYYYFQLKWLAPSLPISFPRIATPSAQKAETAGWKGYTNSKLELSIKYPSSWSLDDRANAPTWARIVFLSDDYDRDTDPQNNYGTRVGLLIAKNQNSGYFRESSTFREFLENSGIQPVGNPEENVNINGNKFTKLTSKENNEINYYFGILHNDKWYTFSSHSKDNSKQKEVENTLRSMLSTFKFLD